MSSAQRTRRPSTESVFWQPGNVLLNIAAKIQVVDHGASARAVAACIPWKGTAANQASPRRPYWQARPAPLAAFVLGRIRRYGRGRSAVM